MAVEPDGKKVYIYNSQKINVYKKDVNNKYLCLKPYKISEEVSALKVNNYKWLMAAYNSSQGINLFNENGSSERTLTLEGVLKKNIDIEVDAVENVYILDTTGIYIFKQQRLLQKR